MKRHSHQTKFKDRTKLTQNWPTNEIYDSVDEAEKQYRTQKIKFQKFARELLDFVPGTTGKLLDVGCGLGWVVAEANKRGFSAIGIDQAKPFITTGKARLKIDLRLSNLEQFQTKDRFDVIVLKHVLEHIKDADSFLQKARQILNQKGILLVACPNAHSLMAWIFQDRWYGLQPEQHVWQFTSKLISSVISRNGFVVEKVVANSLDYEVAGVKGLIFKLLTVVADIIGIGDQVVVVARKAK